MEEQTLEDAHHHFMSGMLDKTMLALLHIIRYVSYLESENWSSKLSVFLLYIKQYIIQK